MMRKQLIVLTAALALLLLLWLPQSASASTIEYTLVPGDRIAVVDFAPNGHESYTNQFAVTGLQADTEFDILYATGTADQPIAQCYYNCTEDLSPEPTTALLRPTNHEGEGIVLWISVTSGSLDLTVTDPANHLTLVRTASSPLYRVPMEKDNSKWFRLTNANLSTIPMVLCGTEGTIIQWYTDPATNSYTYYRFEKRKLYQITYVNGTRQSSEMLAYDTNFYIGDDKYLCVCLQFDISSTGSFFTKMENAYIAVPADWLEYECNLNFETHEWDEEEWESIRDHSDYDVNYTGSVEYTALIPGSGTENDPWQIGAGLRLDPISAGWYEFTGSTTFSKRVAVVGSVHLILDADATLTAPQGINVSPGISLTISGTGALTTGAEENNAAIGGSNGQGAGTIVIDGGTLTVNAGHFASGIGGGYGGGAGNITINGGTVDIHHANSSSGIGTGKSGSGGTVTINGGTVTALGRFGAGIGGGDLASGIDVTINGGTVYAQSYQGGAGIGGGPYSHGGSLTVTGGHVTAVGSTYDGGWGVPGIGSGRPRTNGSSPLNAGNCTITGGTVIAIAGNANEGTGAQAIGANYQDIAADPDNAGTLAIGSCLMVMAGDSENTAVVATGDLITACRSAWVEITDSPAFGEPDFTLPASLTTIEEKAFEGAATRIVLVPANCEAIGDHAFRNCPNLIQIRIPAGCTLGTDVFDPCNLVFIYSAADSPAETYCSTHANCVFVEDAQD